MDDKNSAKVKISYSLLGIIYNFIDVDKKARYYGTDTPLYFSEIHMVSAIKRHEGIHVTGLASELGVTKGAVSQMIIKLEKKGFIKKEKDINNQSKVLLKLTPKGEVAHLNHMKFHETFDSTISELLSGASEDNITFLKHFLSVLEDRIDNLEKRLDD